MEPLALGSLIATVMWFAAKGEVFTDILPTLGVMAMAGYRILPSFQMMYSQFTEITTSRHTLDEICDEMAAAEENVRFEPDLSQKPGLNRNRWCGINKSKYAMSPSHILEQKIRSLKK